MLRNFRMVFDSLFLSGYDAKTLTDVKMTNPKPFTLLIRIRRCDLRVKQNGT